MGRILEKLKEAELVRVKDHNKDKIQFLSIDSLKFSKNRVRKSINPEEIKLMADNFKLFGILQPLEVNEHNEVILGTRRFEAAKLASMKTVPAIRRNSDNIPEIEKQLVSDLHSRHLSLLERAYAFQKLLELKNTTKYGLAKYIGVSNNLMCRTLAILDASPETIRLMKAGKISQRLVAAVLYRLKDRSKEKFVIGRIIREKLSVSQAENLVAEINDSSVLKKHFLKQVKGFATSLKKFKEKSKQIKLGKKEENEIKKELERIKGIIEG